MGPEINTSVKIKSIAALLIVVGMFLAGCATPSNTSNSANQQNPINSGLTESNRLPKSNGILLSNGIPYGIPDLPENIIMMFDISDFTAFLNLNKDKIQELGCKFPDQNNPMIFYPSEEPDKAYVRKGSSVLHIPPNQPISLNVLVHEFYHANCSADVSDSSFSGWIETDKLFNTSDGTEIKLVKQNGGTLVVMIHGKEYPLDALEEMLASMFLVKEIAEYKGELEGVPGAYGYDPIAYSDLFELIQQFMTEMSGQDIPMTDIYRIMGEVTIDVTGKADGFTKFMEKLEQTLPSLGVNEVPGDFRKRLIEKIYMWELTRDGQMDNSNNNFGKQKSKEIVGFRAKEVALIAYSQNLSEVSEEVQLAFNELRNAPNRKERRKSYKLLKTVLRESNSSMSLSLGLRSSL